MALDVNESLFFELNGGDLFILREAVKAMPDHPRHDAVLDKLHVCDESDYSCENGLCDLITGKHW